MEKPDFSPTEPDWAPYFGNNHRKLPPPQVAMGGGVSFGRHFGRPLGRALWEDLVYRLWIGGLCIYRPGDCQWCLGWSGRHCIIDLDEHDNVKDITFFP